MKTLFKFTIGKEEEVELKETSTNEKGEQVTVTKKVKQNVPQHFAILRPTRSMNDRARLFYGVRYAEGIKEGLLPAALLAKRFSNDKGTISDPDKELYTKLYLELVSKQESFEKLSVIKQEDRTEEQRKEFGNLLFELTDLQRKIRDFEFTQSSLFEQTAESYAKEETIRWWILFLSHSGEKDEELKPFFGDGIYDKRIEIYDKLEEENDNFKIKIVKYFTYLIGFWFVSRNSGEITEKDFDFVFKTLEVENKPKEKIEVLSEIKPEVKPEPPKEEVKT